MVVVIGVVGELTFSKHRPGRGDIGPFIRLVMGELEHIEAGEDGGRGQREQERNHNYCWRHVAPHIYASDRVDAAYTGVELSSPVHARVWGAPTVGAPSRCAPTC